VADAVAYLAALRSYGTTDLLGAVRDVFADDSVDTVYLLSGLFAGRLCSSAASHLIN
jgi:hypothetical protein